MLAIVVASSSGIEPSSTLINGCRKTIRASYSRIEAEGGSVETKDETVGRELERPTTGVGDGAVVRADVGARVCARAKDAESKQPHAIAIEKTIAALPFKLSGVCIETQNLRHQRYKQRNYLVELGTKRSR
jgi:hypothetical protein